MWFTHGLNISGFPGVRYGAINTATNTVQVANAFHSGTSDDFNPSLGAHETAANSFNIWLRLSWGNPIVTATGSLDKNWIVCDNTATSAFFGNCYTQYDTTSGNQIRMKTSTNGGLSWGAALAPGGGATGLGGQPVVRPNGTVLVPYISTSVRAGANAYPTIAVATAPTGSTLNLNMYVPTGGLPITGGALTASTTAAATARTATAVPVTAR